MTALRAIFPFNAHGIWVERELLGHSYSTEEQGMPVHLTLPSDRDDFRTWQLLPGEGYWAIGAPSSGTVDDPDQRVSIYVVQISVDIDAAIDEATVRSGGRDEAEVAITAFDSAFEVATKVMRDFLAWVRTDRQSWIGLSSEGPELAGPGSLMDVAADARVPVGHTQRISSMLRGDSPLDATRLGELWSHVESGDAPPVAETLLAYAEHLAWAGGDPPDPLRSVLMAAIACEV
jgi:hypothetical protein